MKKLLLFTLVLVLALSFNACKKDDKTEPAGSTQDDIPIDSTQIKEQVIEIKTKFGNMYMWLYKETPLHRANFLKLAKDEYFDSTTFHRIIAGFVAQGGDPNTKDNDPSDDGNGSPGYTVPAEIKTSIKHNYGAVGAARMPDNVNPAKASSGSQFYIVVNTAGTHGLDGGYTVFGKILGGMPVAQTIVNQPKGANDRPNEFIRMDVNIIEKTRAELKTEFNFVP
jgi:cyclophilin family peptidyl-prolyl cis-trans isomerase